MSDRTASRWRSEWDLPKGVTYLNHGSFGLAPREVVAARQRWFAELSRQPMDFFTRRLGGLLDETAGILAGFVGCKADDLILVPNATTGMNIVARNTPLAPGDEVLLTDHEYGAVVRIWGHACKQAGARTVLARLPRPLERADDVVGAVMRHVTDRTRMIVVSHVTSLSAAILPVQELCARAAERRVPVCVDGPHAVATTPLRLAEIGCDFYAASCHKWLSAPLGSGFLYVRGRRKSGLAPVITSWGSSLSGAPASWKDEFQWSGTSDPGAMLSISEAVRFLNRVGVQEFRRDTHALAAEARRRISEVSGGRPLTPDDPNWYGSMATITLPRAPLAAGPPYRPHPLQAALWDEHRIEVPVFEWQGEMCVRVSCHLYTEADDIERLAEALRLLGV